MRYKSILWSSAALAALMAASLLVDTSSAELKVGAGQPMPRPRPSAMPVPEGQPLGPIQPASADGRYVIIGWNDLGMHCISPRFAEMSILPPFNSIRAIVIRRGVEPSIVTSGMSVKYTLVDNNSVEGKTDFWHFAEQLFGVPLEPGMGLAGKGLWGTMDIVGEEFHADGIPALPLDDKMQWNPLQQAKLTLFRNGLEIANTRIVVPVSDEMDCAKCHKTGGVAAPGIATPTVEGNILTLHDLREGTNLMADRPVMCASCHSDNALGTPGTPGVPSLSAAMHVKHAAIAAQPSCYDCHPGAETQCNRSTLPQMGPVGNDPKCENCHGTLNQVAADLLAGREPWAQEPTCASCHGAQYSTGGVLYREARGHGGIQCVACHNSPHAWYPTSHSVDNLQPMILQRTNRAIGKCSICHTDNRQGTVPPHDDD